MASTAASDPQAASPFRANVIVAEGGLEARERLWRSLRTEGQWDPQIPNFRAPAAAAE